MALVDPAAQEKGHGSNALREGCGVTMSRTTSMALLWVMCSAAGCATDNNTPSPAIVTTNTSAPAITNNAPIAADNGRLRQNLEQALRAATACVMGHANGLAMQPENPDHIALAAMLACDRQEQLVRNAAELVHGRERSLLYMRLIEEEMRKGVVAVVVTLRSRARRQEPTKPSTRWGADI